MFCLVYLCQRADHQAVLVSVSGNVTLLWLGIPGLARKWVILAPNVENSGFSDQSDPLYSLYVVAETICPRLILQVVELTLRKIAI